MKGASSIVALFAAAGAACSSTIMRYPSGWPSFSSAAQDGCDSLQGSFGDRGEQSPGIPASLAEVVFGQHRMLTASSVRISVERGSQLTFTVLDGRAEVLATRTRAFTCSSGAARVQLGASWRGAGAPDGTPLIERESVTLELYPTADALIVKKENHLFLLVLVIPVRDHTTTWHRFTRTSN